MFAGLIWRQAGCTYSSLSLRPRLRRVVPPPSVLSDFSPLLASIARRSCSSSSYAASRLFIVERRFWFALIMLLDVGRPFLLPARGERVPSFEKEAARLARLVLRDSVWWCWCWFW